MDSPTPNVPARRPHPNKAAARGLARGTDALETAALPPTLTILLVRAGMRRKHGPKAIGALQVLSERLDGQLAHEHVGGLRKHVCDCLGDIFRMQSVESFEERLRKWVCSSHRRVDQARLD